MSSLTGNVANRHGVASANLKRVENLLLARTQLLRMAAGTLNVNLADRYFVSPDAMIGPTEYSSGETLWLQRATLHGYRVWIMRPNTHEPTFANVLELTAPVKLRDFFSLANGDSVSVDVEGDDEWWNATKLLHAPT